MNNREQVKNILIGYFNSNYTIDEALDHIERIYGGKE